MTPVDEIRARLAACPIPEGARADWDGTNHYEIQTPFASLEDGYFWLDGISADSEPRCTTTTGKRLGACLDLACAWRPDITVLLAEIDRLRELCTELSGEGADDGR